MKKGNKNERGRNRKKIIGKREGRIARRKDVRKKGRKGRGKKGKEEGVRRKE